MKLALKISVGLFIAWGVLGILLWTQLSDEFKKTQTSKISKEIQQCEYASRCNGQHAIKLSCASAGDVDRCVTIKLAGKPFDEFCDVLPAPISSRPALACRGLLPILKKIYE